MQIKKSKGHITFAGGWEFFERSRDVYRAEIDYPIDVYGYRSSRWECTLVAWEQYKDVILASLKDQFRR